MSTEKKLGQKIILSMITAEDDPAIVKRCLMSVKPILDGWIICDNGSTEDVLRMMEECLKDVPGKIIQTSWIDFGTNRTAALKEALFFAQEMFPNDHAYAFTIDADEELLLTPGYKVPDFDGGPLFGFLMRLGSVYYPRPNFLNLDFGWEFKGAMHEELICHTEGVIQGILSGPVVEVRQEGKRSKDPLRYYKDSETLRKAYEVEPKPRYLFYRAQALRGAAMQEASIATYKKYIATDAVPEEVWYSKLCLARLMIEQNYPERECVEVLLDAHNSRPWRVEPMATLAQYWQQLRKHELAFWACERARKIEPSGDVFFVESNWFEGILEEAFSMNAFLSGHFPEVVEACTNLLKRTNMNPGERERVEKNLQNALAEIDKRRG